MDFFPKGNIGLKDAVERLAAAIYGDSAIAPIENIKTKAGTTFEMDGREFLNADITLERDGQILSERQDRERWKDAIGRIRDALNSGTLKGHVTLDGYQHAVHREYWNSFFEELTFASGEIRADPADDKLAKFDGLTVFLDEADLSRWIDAETGQTQCTVVGRKPGGNARQQDVLHAFRNEYPPEKLTGKRGELTAIAKAFAVRFGYSERGIRNIISSLYRDSLKDA